MQNVLLIGFGFMGKLHAQVYSALPKAKVAAIVDLDVATASAMAKKLGVNAPVYGSFDEALAAGPINVVDVCVPTTFHASYVKLALKAGKHVFCEKPFAATAKESFALAAAATRAGVIMQVGQCIRFWPEYQALEKFTRSKRGGRLLSLSLCRRAGRPRYSVGDWLNDGALSGGAAFDLHIHDTDFVHHLVGQPRAVTSVGTKDATGWSHLFTTYHFDQVAVTAEGGWNYPEQWGFQMSFEAIFERAVIDFDSRANPTLMIAEKSGPRTPMAFESPRVGSAKGSGGNISSLGGYFNEPRYFVDCVARGKQPALATPTQGAQSVRTVLAEIKSAATGRTVKL
ncbi:MAG: Gfo/Idh/MocA family oxidoreductase [Verrucomicrobiota bacterium]